MDDSLYQLKDYNSIQNSIVCRASKKNVIMNKNSKIKRIITKKKGEKQNDRHFMSYDVRSSLNKYEMMNQPCLTETSFEKCNSKSKKRIKTKRNSSISKMANQGKPLNIKQSMVSKQKITYGGVQN